MRDGRSCEGRLVAAEAGLLECEKAKSDLVERLRIAEVRVKELEGKVGGAGEEVASLQSKLASKEVSGTQNLGLDAA